MSIFFSNDAKQLPAGLEHGVNSITVDFGLITTRNLPISVLGQCAGCCIKVAKPAGATSARTAW